MDYEFVDNELLSLIMQLNEIQRVMVYYKEQKGIRLERFNSFLEAIDDMRTQIADYIGRMGERRNDMGS